MPWKIKKSPTGGWDIVKESTGKKVGHTDTKIEAQAAVRARYANYRKGER